MNAGPRARLVTMGSQSCIRPLTEVVELVHGVCLPCGRKWWVLLTHFCKPQSRGGGAVRPLNTPWNTKVQFWTR